MFGFGNDDVSEVPYRLVKSQIRVRGTLVSITDPFDGDSSSVEDVLVEVVHRGGSDAASARKLRIGSGTTDLTVQVSADGRLSSLEYKHVGAGGAVLTAGVKLVGFIASIGLAVAGAVAPLRQVTLRAAEPDKAWEKWLADNAEAADLLTKNADLAKQAASKLVELRVALLEAPNVAESRALVVRAQAVSDALDRARAEVARLEAIYAAWRAAQRVTTSAALECLVGFDEILPRDDASPVETAPERPAAAGSPGFRLWQDFRVILEVVDARRAAGQQGKSHPPIDGDQDDESRLVRWRVPRPVELWVWKASKAGPLVLVTRTPLRIADARCDLFGMELREGAFGEHGGAWTFGEDGSLASIKSSDKSQAAALADALSAAPETLVGAVEQAKKLTDSISGIHDAAAEREKAVAERELAIAKARIELLGVNATADDVAALARAEQAVKLRAASRSISPAAEDLANLKLELERITTENAIAAQRRSAVVEGEVADLKTEVARLEQALLRLPPK